MRTYLRKNRLSLYAAACTALAVGMPALAQVPTDLCGATAGNAIPAAGGTFNGSLAGATSSGFAVGCGSSFTFGTDVWYTYTPTVSGTAALSLCTTATSFDSVLSVHTACPVSGTNSLLICGDDTCGVLSNVSPGLVSGTLYHVRVANYSSSAASAFTLVVTPPVPAPGNDRCVDVVGLSTTNGPYAFTGTGFTVSGDIRLATTEAGALPGSCTGTTSTPTTPGAAPDLYYKFTPSTTNNYNLSLCGTPVWDSVLSIHTGCPISSGNAIACNDDGTCAGGIGLSALLNQSLTGGVPYIIRVARYSTSSTQNVFTLTVTGEPLGTCCPPSGDTCTLTAGSACASPNTFTANVTCTSSPCPVPPPANDACETATIVAGTLPQTFVSGGPLATDDIDVTCNTTGASTTVAGVWYVYTTGASNGVLNYTENTDNDVIVAAFTGGCAGLSQTFCADGETAIDILMNSATTYHILVGRWGTTAPTVPYSITFNSFTPIVAPTNDTCETATIVAGALPQTFTASGALATDDLDVTCNSTAAAGVVSGVWYTYTTGANQGNLNYSETGSNDVIVAAFTGGCAGLNQVFCSDAETGINITMNPGTTYHILLGMWGTSVPTSSYSITFNSFTALLGVCCNTASGTCTAVANAAACSGANQAYQGDGSVCSPNPCPPTGACCDVNGLCTITTAAGCTGTNVFQGTSSVCDPNPCPPPPAPANDTCATATIVAGALPQTFTSGGPQTTDDIDVTCNTTGAISTVAGVWYSYTTGANQGNLNYTEGSTNDVIVAAFTGQCDGPDFTQVFCSDAETGINIAMNASTTYSILVGRWGTTTPTVLYSITFNSFTALLGACCNGATGACTPVANAAACAGANEAYQGDGSVCSPNPCPQPIACCFSSGVCVMGLPAACTGAGGTNTGGTTCAPSPCAAPVNQTCATAAVLPANTWVLGNNNGVSDINLSFPQATCQDSTGKDVWYSFTASASDSHTFLTCGSFIDTVIQLYTVGDCNDANSYTAVGCDDDSCAGTEATVIPLSTGPGSGLASTLSVTLSAGTTYYVRLSSYDPDDTDGVPPVGGNYQLRVNAPVASTVVCCRGTTCTIVAPAACTVPATPIVGASQSAAVACGVSNSIANGCCFADFTKSSGVNIDDIFVYLNAWFASSPYTDIGGDGVSTPNIDDIFIFLNAWFAGCPS